MRRTLPFLALALLAHAPDAHPEATLAPDPAANSPKECATSGRSGNGPLPGRAAEPAGFRPVACLDLGAADVRGSPAAERTRARLAEIAPGWRFSENPRLELVPEPSGRAAPPGGEAYTAGRTVPRARFPAGWTGGYSPVWITRDVSEERLTRVYLSFRLKISENWQGHPVGDKLLYVWSHDRPVFFPLHVGGGHAPLSAQVRIQDVPAGARNFPPNLRGAPVERGRWHRWELLLVSNTPGVADGEIHWWIDGEKKGEHLAVEFAGPDQDDVWQILSWRPVWGGRGGVVRADQFMWIDDVYLSGAR